MIKRHLRFLLNRLFAFVLRRRSTPYVASPGTVTLVLAPHQDDETLGCGGLIARRRLDAQPVHVAFVTDGSGSHPDHPTLTREALATVRAAEARAALRKLGVETPAIHFLGLRDGTLNKLSPAESADAIERIAQLLERVQPDEVLLPYRHDGSSEHEAAFLLFASALRRHQRRVRVLEFPVWSWWSPTLLLRPVLRVRKVVRFSFSGYAFLKTDALAAYRSQVAPTPPWPDALLSADFCRMFARDEEFYFEIEP